jgi:hypothetical protein
MKINNTPNLQRPVPVSGTKRGALSGLEKHP